MEFLAFSNNLGSHLTVSYVPERGTWVSLPQHLATHLLTTRPQLPVVLNIRHDGRAGPGAYVAWTGAVCAAGCLGIPAPLARSLMLPEGASVTLSTMADVPYATSITLQPVSSDDWEVVELNASHIEEQLLNQAGVAALNKALPLWVRGQQTQLMVTAVQPEGSPVVRLTRGCEVLVAPRVRQLQGTGGAAGVIAGGGRNSTAQQDPGSKEKTNAPASLRLQSFSFTVESFENNLGTQLPTLVGRAAMSPSTLHRIGIKEGDWVHVSGCNARALVASVHAHPGVTPGHLALSPEDIDKELKAKPFDLVMLVRMTTFERENFTETALTESILGNGGPKLCKQTLYANTAACRREGPHLQAAAAASLLPGTSDVLVSVLERLLPTISVPMKSVLQEWGSPKPGAVLLTGPSGSGKTSLTATLCDTLTNHPQCMASTHIVRCKDLVVDGGASAVRSQLVPYFRAAIAHPPAIVVLDDLDVLCPIDPEAQGQQQGAGDPALVSWLCQVLDGLTEHRISLESGPTWIPVAVVATATSVSALPPARCRPGRLDTTLTLPPPTPGSRAAMMAAGVVARAAAVDAVHLDAAAEAAEGYDGGDINTLLDRAVLLAVARQVATGYVTAKEEVLRVQASDLQGAMEGLTPATFWGVGTKGAGHQQNMGWHLVGGLQEVKEALQEALELPSRYAKLVSRAPLRLRTGVLLYGPPGCGKTHIVGAAVAAVGMRCITVSGPELLNKYIGASEAAVRDVFRKAAAAAPSIIFFDEFDALAPQRGHDNTGVTDRVVNQLLTELDGVQGLKGVAVIAATSRPDLVDAALLRPGRLDRILHCGFPSHAERVDILKALSHGIAVAEDVDWQGIAAATEHYSGADLGAVLSEAQLAAAHEVLEAALPSGGAVVVEGRHLHDALHIVKPSVSLMVRDDLESVYERFKQGKTAPRDSEKGKKVTWA